MVWDVIALISQSISECGSTLYLGMVYVEDIYMPAKRDMSSILILLQW